MNLAKRFFGHLRTVLTHKKEVAKICFKFGLYKQGIFHDMSKFSPTEFFSSVKYYQGNRSPIEAEKEDKGYSMAWAHHHNRNPHHWMYWLDYDRVNEPAPMRIPYKYAVEAIADWIGAGRAYCKNSKTEFTWDEPYEYYKRNTRVNSDENIDFQTRQLWDTMLVDLMLYGLDVVAIQVKNGVYEQIYNTPIDKDGNRVIYNLKEYNDLVIKYYTGDGK
jgi:hypothetical protein